MTARSVDVGRELTTSTTQENDWGIGERNTICQSHVIDCHVTLGGYHMILDGQPMTLWCDHTTMSGGHMTLWCDHMTLSGFTRHCGVIT